LDLVSESNLIKAEKRKETENEEKDRDGRTHSSNSSPFSLINQSPDLITTSTSPTSQTSFEGVSIRFGGGDDGEFLELEGRFRVGLGLEL
jgi:hypothetical protein